MGEARIFNSRAYNDRRKIGEIRDGDLYVDDSGDAPYPVSVRQSGEWVNGLLRLGADGLVPDTSLSTSVPMLSEGVLPLSTIPESVLPPFETIKSVVTEYTSGDHSFWSPTGLSVPVTFGRQVYFVARIVYRSDDGLGARFTINGPDAVRVTYVSRYPLTTTTETVNYCSQYLLPAAANASSIAADPDNYQTGENIAIIEGIVLPFTDGTLEVLYATTGVSEKFVTIKNGSYLFTEHFLAGEIVSGG